MQTVENYVEANQVNQTKFCKGRGKRKFERGDKVIIKDYREAGKVKWIDGIVKKKIGKRFYIVEIVVHNKKIEAKRHVNQIILSNKSNYVPHILKNPSEKLTTIINNEQGQSVGHGINESVVAVMKNYNLTSISISL